MAFDFGLAKNAFSKPVDSGLMASLALSKATAGAVSPVVLNRPYIVNGESWYKVFPYVFAIENLTTGNPLFRYALPIPPESIVTQMICPTEVVPTLGGVVEEPSAAVFWSIQLAGTMGSSVAREGGLGADQAQTGNNLSQMAKAFRTSLSTTGLLSGLVSNLMKPIDTITTAMGAFKGLSGADSFATAMQAANQPFLPYSESAVNKNSNGYVEIHNFHRFLIFYTHLNSRKDANNPDSLGKNYANSQYGLYFYNYKDNQKFRIVLKNFMIMKSQNSPFLYRYQCQFKGWSLESANSNPSALAVDRFKGDLATVNTANITSTLTKAKSLVRGFKSATTDPLGTFLSSPPVI